MNVAKFTETKVITAFKTVSFFGLLFSFYFLFFQDPANLKVEMFSKVTSKNGEKMLNI